VRRLLHLIIAAAVLVTFGASSYATSETEWISYPLGDWFIDSNWSNQNPNNAPGCSFVCAQNAYISNGGTALINAPGAVAADVNVGAFSSTSGSLLITRSGSATPGSLSCAHLYAGEGGGPGTGVGATGSITFSSGATGHVSGDGSEVAVGFGSQATGTLTVTDAGSVLELRAGGFFGVGGFITVGAGTSQGTLRIENGGRLSAIDAAFGTDAGSNGAVTVTGAGSALETYGLTGFEVGSAGQGSLILSAGGQVVSGLNRNNTGVSIASSTGSAGSVTITGTGSSWTETGNFYIGGRNDFGTCVNGGSAILRIQSAGLVQASGLKFFSGGELTVDNGSTQTPGLMLIGGANSLPTGGTLGDLVIGRAAPGRMEIRTGGTVFDDRGFIGFNAGKNGAVLVTGAGSQWSNTGSVSVGQAAIGSLQIFDGGSVISNDAFIAYSNALGNEAVVSGAGSNWTISNKLFIGGSGLGPGGSGTLRIENGGVVTATAATLYNTGGLIFGANATLNTPLNVLGGYIEFIVDQTTFPNNMTLGTGGVGLYTYNTGGAYTATLTGSISGSGGLTAGNVLGSTPGVFILTGSSNYTGATTLNAGTLRVNGSIASAVTVKNGVTLGGSGSVGSVVVNSGGIVSPGNSPGKLSVNGNYTQNSGGVLNIEIGGASPGAGGYDQLAVSGTATLGGTLNLSLVNGFRPTVGQTFNIITSSSEAGNFSTINSSGFTATSSAGGGGITLTITSVQPGLPLITSATSASGTQDQPFSYQITATDSPDSFAATGLPSGLMINTATGVISGSPDASGGFDVTISAANSVGTGSALLSLSIAAPAPTPTPTATPTTLGNISTRLRVETGDNVLIGGFIITGTQDKKVIIRAIGPSLPVADALPDPFLELHDGSGQLLDSNDNWVDSPDKQAIIDSTIPPSNDLESAIVATLPANSSAYTAIVRGVNDTTGVGLVEVYDLDRSVDSKLANISTRGLVQTGDNVMIGGFIVLGKSSQKVIVRAIGPSLPVSGALADPTLELHDGNGALLEANDNWMDSPNKQAIIDSTIPPTNPLESAIVATLVPGNYTAIVRGVNDTTGVALVEVYALP
jgi:T5SS/PEP-CTERM-associated repeat protein